jgi:hypothetical protein
VNLSLAVAVERANSTRATTSKAPIQLGGLLPLAIAGPSGIVVKLPLQIATVEVGVGHIHIVWLCSRAAGLATITICVKGTLDQPP